MARAMKLNGWRAALWSAAALLLAAALVTMRVSDGVAWDLFDFAVFGATVTAVCGAFELAARASGHAAHRLAMLLALVTAFLIVWGNLAVGFIGDEDNPANLAFVGVLLVGLVGGLLARLRPAGMAGAMVATAAAQAGAAVFASFVGVWPEGLLTAAFVLPWLVSAWLFAVAAR